MLDFVSIETIPSRGTTIIRPEFKIKESNDLMIRGKNFYAVWDEEAGIWSKDEKDIRRIIDGMIYEYADQNKSNESKSLKLLGDFSSNQWNQWQKYCKALPDSYHELDKKIIFSNTPIRKEDYVTKALNYPLQEGSIESYEELVGVLYDPVELRKIEWAIGAIISGDSKSLQKFIVLYGPPGSGKSTILNIIQLLFEGYYATFDSKALSSASNAFALEAFKDNPLIAIEHDGDLSRIEDNTRLNSIISHEWMTINEKHKSLYMSQFQSFLFMGTNKPVKITDAKSGILRRLIDVSPTGRKISKERFDYLMARIPFELSGIAWHCLEVYSGLGPNYYNSYVPTSMMSRTNDIYNFIEDNYDFFLDIPEDGIPLRTMWLRYKDYCVDANVLYPYSLRVFKDEMKNYFAEFKDRYKGGRSIYIGFLKERFEYSSDSNNDQNGSNMVDLMDESWLMLKEQTSIFDLEFANCPAQYANSEDIPERSWDKVKTKLKQLDTRKVHYVRPPENLIVIDFDLKDEKGEKCFERNLEAAKKWPKTYAEISKGGAGIHLHYCYDGVVDSLSRVFDEDIEVKVFTGKSSLRRKLTKCNNVEIATISSGLFLKERRKKMITDYVIRSEKDLRERIKKNLRKEIHANTKPSVDFIYQILEEAYEQGLKYDVSDMAPSIQAFAMGSTHQADACMKLVSKMKFQSEEPSENVEQYVEEALIVFFDIEIFPNLFIVCWKKQGEGCEVVKMINPSATDVEELFQFKLVGFNNRKYDNHMVYAAAMGYNVEQLYKLSQRIIVEQDKNAFFGEAYNLSYTDIYDFLSAGNKMSLKKWEIKLGIHHQEFPLPWDQPVPEERWKEAADYCANDVLATEAVFNANQNDWLARQILAEWADMTVNDTTNSLTTRLIVGRDSNPQSQFIYTDLSTIFPGYKFNKFGIDPGEYKEGVKVSSGKSVYRGEDPSEGGYVYAEPGIHYKVAVLDVESMHPHSAIRLKIFGETYTGRFADIVKARLAIKHKDYDLARRILPEKLHKYLEDAGEAKKVANAMKTAINSVYGLTSATFPNKLRDPRNEDNIVAKYGALFMINLKHEVQDRGFTVVHIKTDSIKIENATPEIIEFVHSYGAEYGYKFNHEATYSKMCLVNDAVYIAKLDSVKRCMERYGYCPEENAEDPEERWTATGTQFQVPYVFKTLFSKEPIEFGDLCETKSVTTALYLDMNEGLDKKLNNLKLEDVDEGTKSYTFDMETGRYHDYHFVGRVGSFCPIKPGCGGGILLREKDGKYNAATGTKKPGTKDEVYRWLEAEMVKELGKEKDIDRSYYNALVDAAVDEISKYGDFEMFVSNETEDMNWLKVPDTDKEELPFEECMNEPA